MYKVFIVCGSPGAGKSTYAKHLAQNKRAVFLNIDTVIEHLVSAGLKLGDLDPNDRDSPTYKKAFRESIYQTLYDLARDNLEFLDVVIEGPFTQELRKPDWPQELSAELKAEVEVHYLYCSPDIRKKRMQLRNSHRDQAKFKDWEKYLKYYGNESPPVFDHVYVDTTTLTLN